MTAVCSKKKTEKAKDAVDELLESKRRMNATMRWQTKPRPRRIEPKKKEVIVGAKEVVELAGWMYMPLRPSIAESARDAMYFHSLKELSAYVEKAYLVDHGKMFVGISARGIRNDFLGVQDLRIVQILTADSDGGEYFPIACGHCFSVYCTETWESVRRKAMV